MSIGGLVLALIVVWVGIAVVEAVTGWNRDDKPENGQSKKA